MCQKYSPTSSDHACQPDAHQNQNSQNSFPGTIRTLKTDLGIDTPTNPQDRLQQAGNFVQARPTLEPTPATTKPPVNAIPTPTPQSAALPAEVAFIGDDSF